MLACKHLSHAGEGVSLPACSVSGGDAIWGRASFQPLEEASTDDFLGEKALLSSLLVPYTVSALLRLFIFAIISLCSSLSV